MHLVSSTKSHFFNCNPCDWHPHSYPHGSSQVVHLQAICEQLGRKVLIIHYRWTLVPNNNATYKRVHATHDRSYRPLSTSTTSSSFNTTTSAHFYCHVVGLFVAIRFKRWGIFSTVIGCGLQLCLEWLPFQALLLCLVRGFTERFLIWAAPIVSHCRSKGVERTSCSLTITYRPTIVSLLARSDGPEEVWVMIRI